VTILNVSDWRVDDSNTTCTQYIQAFTNPGKELRTVDIMVRPTAFAACLLLCFVAAALADSPAIFLADALGSSNVPEKAELDGHEPGYHTDTDQPHEVACLQQLNYKSCRYTDCILDESAPPCPSTIAFQ
jgi:hypothetical protein